MKKVLLVVISMLFIAAPQLLAEDDPCKAKMTALGENKKDPKAISRILDELETAGCVEKIGDKWFYWNRGIVRHRLRNYTGAEQDFAVLLTLGLPPKDQANVMTRHADNLVLLERYDEAQKELLAALELRPESGMALMRLAEVYWYKKEKQKALDTIMRFKALSPEDPRMLYEVANFLHTYQFDPEAISAYQEFHRVKSGTQMTYFNLARSYHRTGQTELASEGFIKAYELKPSDLRPIKIGVSLLMMDKNEEAAIGLAEKAFGIRGRSEIGIALYLAQLYKETQWCRDVAYWYNKAAELEADGMKEEYLSQAEYFKAKTSDCQEGSRRKYGKQE